MTVIENQTISASAGTGKTWTLTHRYLALMRMGVAPERICALTFSRKAAGEIFDAIVGRLCLSITDAHERKVTADQIRRHWPAASREDIALDAGQALALLRTLLNEMHRLRIGTLDSFILGIARAFPLELGLPPDLRPMDNDGAEAQARRRNLLMRLCDPVRGFRRGDAVSAGFLQAFQLAMYGKADKSLGRRLDALIDEGHRFFLDHREKQWGEASGIWPERRWWENPPSMLLETACSPDYQDAVRMAFGPQPRSVQLGDACRKIVDAAARHASDRAWPEKLSASILPRLLAHLACSDAVPNLLYFKKDYALPATLWPPLRAALANLVDVEIRRCLASTAGLSSLLRQFDHGYVEAQLRDGCLSFDDFARRLGEDPHQPSLDSEAVDRLYIDYRLDGRLDHWLLDEFQDTSDIQWRAIANLIGESVQDTTGRRSVFYVGDTKQSIYGWRSGNYRLFDAVRRQFGIPAGEPLRVCRRSLPAIVDTVNTVFDGLQDGCRDTDIRVGPHAGAVSAFLSQWQTHESGRIGEGDGFAALLCYSCASPGSGNVGGESGEPDAETDLNGSEPFEAVARLVMASAPVARGFSVAVLVRNNAEGRVCADVLRRRLDGIPVVHEGTGGIMDNPVVPLLLSLVRLAAHPADTQAARHLDMSPRVQHTDGSEGSLGDGVRGLLQAVHHDGFAGALRPWGEALVASCPDESASFSRQRLCEFLAAAEQFDAAGSRDPDAFAEAIRAHMIKSEAAPGSIRVMTIHQSKGLGFDVVFLPMMRNPRTRFNATASLRFLHSDLGQAFPSRDGWVLRPPRREVIVGAGGALPSVLDAAHAESDYAQLCVLYVALTRAKRALFMLVPEPSANPTVLYVCDFLRERLVGAGEGEPVPFCGLSRLLFFGDAEGFLSSAERPAAAPVAAVPPSPPRLSFMQETVRREPSKESGRDTRFPADYLFDREAVAVREFGSAIHRLFERIAWIEDAEVEALIADWRASAPEAESLLRDVEDQFRHCLSLPSVWALLSRPTGTARAEVWRESSFDDVRDSASGREIVSGRFDRLVLERDARGQVCRATVVDFKSNRVADDAAAATAARDYRLQMRDYACAAAHLLDLPVTAVRAVLLFTRIGVVLDVD